MKRRLEEQRIELSNQKFLATPLVGIIDWTIIQHRNLAFCSFRCRKRRERKRKAAMSRNNV
ncbi:MAG: hypothetical protein MK226_05285 [Saprospiraceae bacterium]|nr:hypothetical protein [Saprospiraceae bacterium]